MTAEPGALAPFAELAQFQIDASSVQMLGYSFCKKKHVVVLGVVDLQATDAVTVGVLDPDDLALRKTVRDFLKRPIEVVRLNAYEIRKALDIGYERYEPGDHDPRLELQTTSDLNFDPEHPVQAVLSDLLGRAVTLGASDIHIECYPGDVDVRLRIDGVLHQLATPLNSENIVGVVSQLKGLARLDSAEEQVAQAGQVSASFSRDGDARQIQFRLSVVPGPVGEDVVLRLAGADKPVLPLGQLGLDDDVTGFVAAMIENPEGLLVVTGPARSGKTTTAYAILDVVNTDENKVLTIEDPIEHRFAKANQKQVTPRMGFAAYTRAFLSQDPDVIMIGEIRDEPTAHVAAHAAQAGHLVLSGLPANDAVATVPRLRSLGLEPGVVGDVMLGALAQRLVRRICDACRVSDEPGPLAAHVFQRLGRAFPLQRGAGCEACNGTGYRGRLGIFELFAVDGRLSDLIASGAPGYELRVAARRAGMRSLFETALARVQAGATTFAELRRCVPVRMISEPMRHELG